MRCVRCARVSDALAAWCRPSRSAGQRLPGGNPRLPRGGGGERRTFSWFSVRSSLISRSTRNDSISFSNAPETFLIATLCCVVVSRHALHARGGVGSGSFASSAQRKQRAQRRARTQGVGQGAPHDAVRAGANGLDEGVASRHLERVARHLKLALAGRARELHGGRRGRRDYAVAILGLQIHVRRRGGGRGVGTACARAPHSGSARPVRQPPTVQAAGWSRGNGELRAATV